MNPLLTLLFTKMRTRPGMVILGAVFLVFLLVLMRPRASVEPEHDLEQRLFVKVKRAVTGQKIRLDHDTEEHLIYAGIRAPQNDEPLQAEATRRNEELVGRRELRLRFDEVNRDEDGRLMAYVFDGEQFINETLVREGLAYARVTTTATRFAKRLLAAQAEARKKGRGVWASRTTSQEASYPADPKYGSFHRPTCADAPKIKPERLVSFKSVNEAVEKGFAPCSKCKP